MPDHVLAVEGYVPAGGDSGQEPRTRFVLDGGPGRAQWIARVLELDPDRVGVDAIARCVGRDARRWSQDPSRVPGGVGLADELRDAAVQGHEVVGADTALRPLEPACRRLEAAIGRMDDDRARLLPASPLPEVRRFPLIDPRWSPVAHELIVGSLGSQAVTCPAFLSIPGARGDIAGRSLENAQG